MTLTTGPNLIPKPKPNPNFPENLNISPSTYVHGIPHVIPDNDHQSNQEDVFGTLAQREAIRKYGIAGRFWEAAYALNLYVDPPDNWTFDPPLVRGSDVGHRLTIVELGSGSGIVGFKIAEMLEMGRDMVIVTDLPEVCPLLEANLRRHRKRREHLGDAFDDVVLVRPLAWGNSEHALGVVSELLSSEKLTAKARFLTHIVCSDLVYFPELLAPLLRTLIQLSSPHFIPPLRCGTPASDPTIIISYKIRSLSKESPFWSAFGLWFTFEPVLVKSKANSSWRRFDSLLDDPTFIFVARRRPYSFAWEVPAIDQDLLDGVGAWGTEARKVDDAFETLLLMSLNDEEEV